MSVIHVDPSKWRNRDFAWVKFCADPNDTNLDGLIKWLSSELGLQITQAEILKAILPEFLDLGTELKKRFPEKSHDEVIQIRSELFAAALELSVRWYEEFKDRSGADLKWVDTLEIPLTPMIGEWNPDGWQVKDFLKEPNHENLRHLIDYFELQHRVFVRLFAAMWRERMDPAKLEDIRSTSDLEIVMSGVIMLIAKACNRWASEVIGITTDSHRFLEFANSSEFLGTPSKKQKRISKKQKKSRKKR
jgi:hypothetical protein